MKVIIMGKRCGGKMDGAKERHPRTRNQRHDRSGGMGETLTTHVSHHFTWTPP